MTISVLIKSGTGGWFDEDGCDFCLKRYEKISTSTNISIPRIGETIKLFEETDRKNKNGMIYKQFNSYHVVNVEYLFGDYNNDINYAVNIYVLPIGRTPKY